MIDSAYHGNWRGILFICNFREHCENVYSVLKGTKTRICVEFVIK